MANIAVNIVGNDKSASSAMDNVGQKASGLRSRLGNIGSGMAKVFGGIELHELADKVVDFAKESVNKLNEVAQTTRMLQRIMGGTPEQVSALAFAADHMGVSAQTLATSSGIMAKGLAGGKSALIGMGIETKNADGSLRNVTDLIPEVAEKFSHMTDSSKRTALAMQLFGRGGKDMLPLLMKGKEGIAELEGEAGKLGLTMSGKAMASTLKYQMAQKTLQASVEGLQMKLGVALYPQLIKLTSVLSGQVIPAVMGFFNWMQKNPAVIQSIAHVIGPLIAAIVVIIGAIKAWTIVQGILDVVLDANPIGMLILAVGALIAIVLLIVANWKVIGPWLSNLWTSILSFLTGVWNNIVSFLQDAINRGIQIFMNFTPLGIIVSHFGQILDFFRNLPSEFVAGFSWVMSTMNQIGSQIIQGLINGVTNMASGAVSAVVNVATGAINAAKNALGIHSPSQVFHDIGRNVGHGFVNGIKSTHGLAHAAMSGLVQTPTLSGMGLSGALSGSQGGAVTAQAARQSGGVFIGQFHAGGMSPNQVASEMGWLERWAT